MNYKRIRSLPGLPLLGKELTEQAAQKRTYVLRVVYAVALYVAFVFAGGESLWQRTETSVTDLGQGLPIFQKIVQLQLWGIYLFLPALMAGAIPSEKERGSLDLLFLTDLSPWELILQKYWGRLMPMFSFLLLALPLTAIAYSMGGVSRTMLLAGGLTLALTVLQVGAVALMFSAYSQTTTEAFLRCYLLGPLLYLSCFIPGFGWSQVGAGWLERGDSLIAMALISVLGLFLAWVWLASAKRCLLTRAHAPGKNVVEEQFKRLQRFGRDCRRLWRGILRPVDRDAHVAELVARYGGPKAGPVTQETLWQILLRRLPVPTLISLLVVAGWILCLIVMAGGFEAREQSGFLSFLVFTVWAVAALTLTVQSANAIAAERVNQTLDILLTTPLTGDEIIRQKMAPAWKLTRLLLGLFAALFLLEAWAESESHRLADLLRPETLTYLAASLLSLLYLPLLCWVGLWTGLKLRGRLRAPVVAIGVVVVWCAGPWLLLRPYWSEAGIGSTSWLDNPCYYTLLLSPYTMLRITEQSQFKELFAEPAWVPLAVNFLFYAGLWRFIRRLCLANADRSLGRVGSTE